MAYDAGRGRIVLFGGFDRDTNGLLDDVWEWDGTRWYGPFSAAGGPGARRSHSMAYDGSTGRVAVFGGDRALTVDAPNDVWEWDGSSWYGPFAPTDRPDARSQASLVYDSVRDRMVMFGGGGVTGYKTDLWEWDASSSREPAVQFAASYASGGIDTAGVSGLRVRARCGGSFSPFTSSDTGAVLAGWATGGPGLAPGSWLHLGANQVGISPTSPQLPQTAGALIEWNSASAAEAHRFLFAGSGTSSFRCAPAGNSGKGIAQVALDYIEVRVRYSH
jgi:hypothetical protein